MSSTKFIFIGPIGKRKWLLWPLIGWKFSVSTRQPVNVFNETCQKASTQRLCQVCAFGPIGNQRWPPWPLIGKNIFNFASATAERNVIKFDRKQLVNDPNEVCVFYADQLRVPSNRPGIWLAETFSVSPLKLLNGIWLNSTEVGLIEKKKMTVLAYDWVRHILSLVSSQFEFWLNLTGTNFSLIPLFVESAAHNRRTPGPRNVPHPVSAHAHFVTRRTRNPPLCAGEDRPATTGAISRGQSSKTNWFGIKSAKQFSVRMDVQFSSFFTNKRKWIKTQRKHYAHSKMCMSMYAPL